MEILNWSKFLLPYEQAVDELSVKFSSLAREYRSLEMHSPIEQVEGRVKRVSSILAKANRKKVEFENIETKIEDLAGIRIICKFAEDIERVIDLIRERDGHDLKVLQERDYIKNTKPSGYRSYHIIIAYSVFTTEGYKEVLAEIQIRTLAMNFWAIIEHSLKYKYSGKIPDDIKERLVISAEAAFQLDKEMGTIRGEILEAQKIVKIKTDLVDEILNRIESLHYVAKVERMNELNRQFYDLCKEDNLDKLLSFNHQLKIMSEMYKVQYV